jgi:hypothetical protein
MREYTVMAPSRSRQPAVSHASKIVLSAEGLVPVVDVTAREFITLVSVINLLSQKRKTNRKLTVRIYHSPKESFGHVSRLASHDRHYLPAKCCLHFLTIS